MDPVKILKRAWYILWSYRALWVFGLILALTAAGSSGSSANNGSRWTVDSQQSYQVEQLPDAIRDGLRDLERAFEEAERSIEFDLGELTSVLWIAAVFILLMLVFGIVMAVARYVSETAVIRMVDKYEAAETKMTVREGFRTGWSVTSWRLFLINLILHLPVIILLAIMVIAGFSIYASIKSGNEAYAAMSIISTIGLLFLLLFVVLILSIFLRLLRHFLWRVCALEDVGVGESFSRGFALMRENWKNIGLMWLVMIGLGIVWAIVSFVIVLFTLPLILVTLIIAIFVVAIPVLLLVGLFNLFIGN
ncbi:MAG TPA: hypothetical protein VIS72_13780, partial [Anaerolineales bacterium]